MPRLEDFNSIHEFSVSRSEWAVKERWQLTNRKTMRCCLHWLRYRTLTLSPNHVICQPINADPTLRRVLQIHTCYAAIRFVLHYERKKWNYRGRIKCQYGCDLFCARWTINTRTVGLRWRPNPLFNTVRKVARPLPFLCTTDNVRFSGAIILC